MEGNGEIIEINIRIEMKKGIRKIKKRVEKEVKRKWEIKTSYRNGL